MTTVSLLSTPLTTLLPNSSPQKNPNYNNAFSVNLPSLSQNTSPLNSNNFANKVVQDFTNKMNPSINLAQLRGGLTLSKSNNIITALQGQDMVQDAQNKLSDLNSSRSSIFPTDGTGKLSFNEKFANSTFGKNYGTWSSGLNTANTLFTGLFGEKSEYDGEKGDVTRSIDSVYDTIQNFAGTIPGVGQAISLGMGANKLLGNVVNKLGGGTDGMTNVDSILGSSFLSLTPFGLINGFGGKRADTITKNNEVFEQVGSSYTGSESNVDDALTKSGKKYGLFSSGARKEANRQIAEAKRQQSIIEDIADEATDRFAIRDSMAAINGNRRKYYLQGGYNQANVRVGRSGMSLDLIAKAKKVLSEPRKLQTGGTAKDPFEYYVSTLPASQRDSSNFRVRDYWQYNGQPKDFDEAKKRGMFEWVEDFDSNGKSLGWSWHAFTVAKNPNADEYDFMKSSSHPTVQKELDWYNSNSPDAVEFRNNYELQRTEPYWKYVRRKRDTISHKEGGQMQVKTTEILIVEPELIEDGVDLFKDGGAINIIPEGALHARKHNMDMEGITPKGIPVVSNKEGGEVEQQAEIEREEIIFRLEVTKKLEELEKKYYDDETSQKEKDECALEAGKLLVEEILYNTQDNTNSLL